MLNLSKYFIFLYKFNSEIFFKQNFLSSRLLKKRSSYTCLTEMMHFTGNEN